MKRFYLAIFAIVTFFSCVAGVYGRNDEVITLPLREGNSCGPDLHWELDEEGTLTIMGTGYMDNFTTGGSPWFANKLLITHVVIEEGVKSVGDYAFQGCTNLIDVKMPDSLETIGERSFYYCSAIKNLIMGSGLKSIGSGSFYECSNLVNLTLSDNVLSIGSFAFAFCKKLTNLRLSNNLERILSYGFLFCNELTNLTVPKSVKSIGAFALATNSIHITSFEVEEGSEYFKTIDGVLFDYNITKLIQYPAGKVAIENYVIPETVRTIESGAFDYSQLSNITIPTGVKMLDYGVFRFCHNLAYVNIPEGLESIESSAFYECISLVNLTIPETVNHIEDDAFQKCSNLKSVFYQGYSPISSSTAFKSLPSLTDVCTPPDYTSDTFCGATVTPSSEICQTYQSFFTLCGQGSCIDGVVVEVLWDSATAWENQTNECEEYRCDRVYGFVSWSNCNTTDYMRRVCMNEQCIETRILEKGNCGPDLHWELDEEETLIINGTGYMDNYTTGGSPWFANKSLITHIVIGEGVKSVGKYAFEKCTNLIDVEMPDSLELIGQSAFTSSSLTNVTGNGVKSIGTAAFYCCSNLVNLTLSDSVISIGSVAFAFCENLVNVKLSNNLERIEDYCFMDCPELSNITIPKSLQYVGKMGLCSTSSHVTSIDVEDGNEYFKSVDGVLFDYNITKLVQYPSGKIDIENYIIPETVKIFGVGAFGYSQLTRITVPSGVKDLSDSVFVNCDKLAYVNIPEGLESIGSQAFYECTSLVNLTIPETVNHIEDDAFQLCSNLKSVFYQGSSPISSTAFVSLTSLTDVCTPPGYTSDTLCGASVTPSSEICQTYQSFFTPCGRGNYVDGVVVEVLWDNATAWEQQTNGCEEYHCDRVYGFVSWRNCNTSDKVNRVCVSGQCIENDAIDDDDKSWSVEIDMNNLTLDEVNESDIMDILSNLTGITNITIGTEVDDKGNVICIVIYAKDQSVAKILAEAVNEIKEEDDSLFRKAVNVAVKSEVRWLSNGHQIKINVLMFLMMMMMITMTTM